MNTTFTQDDIDQKLGSFRDFRQNDADDVLRNEGEITKLMSGGALAEFMDTVPLFFQMLKDYFSGKYKEVPVRTIAAIIGSLAYVLCPVDLVSDFIPVVGYLDDAAVITTTIPTKREIQGVQGK